MTEWQCKSSIFSLFKRPEQGDLIVFKTPADNRTDYIKRLIGKPGDEIQFINGDLFINGSKVVREETKISEPIRCGNLILETNTFVETSLHEKVTFMEAGASPNGPISLDKFNMLDLVLCEHNVLARLKQLRSIWEASLASNHFLVCCKFWVRKR